MSELFSTDFVAAIEQLSLDVAAAAPSIIPGSHLSRVAGSSLDFRDFRTYTPGDDLRRVDWNVYRRSGHLFLRQFDHPTTAPVYVALDTSQSMFVESPSRYAAAARVAAAVAAASIREHDGVSIIPLAQNAGGALARVSGRRRIPEVLGYLESQRPGGGSAFGAIAEALARVGRRTGVAVIISDFFDEDGIDHLVDSLSSIAHRIILAQITQPWDAEPDLDAEAELLDCETARTTTVLPAAETLSRYRQAYGAYQAELGRFAGRRASRLVQFDASSPILGQLGVLFPAGTLHVAEVRR